MNDDALTVARWCWPEPDEWTVSDMPYVIRDTDDGRMPECFDPSSPHDVHEAEDVLIERGHAEAYGAWLTSELFGRQVVNTSERAALIATAPLDARVKAMAAVIRWLAK